MVCRLGQIRVWISVGTALIKVRDGARRKTTARIADMYLDIPPFRSLALSCFLPLSPLAQILLSSM